MSLWQIAQAAVLIRTSPGPGSASSTVSIVNGAPKARQTAALVFMGEFSAAIALGQAAKVSRSAGFRSSAVLRRGSIILWGGPLTVMSGARVQRLAAARVSF